jgi:hypothetical protein
MQMRTAMAILISGSRTSRRSGVRRLPYSYSEISWIWSRKGTEEIEFRKVATSEATKKIQQLGLQYAEVSAKTGANIKEFFKNLAQIIAGVGKKNASGSTAEPEKPRASEQKPSGGNKLVNPATQDN